VVNLIRDSEHGCNFKIPGFWM